MHEASAPNFPPEWRPLVDKAAEVLRVFALNEAAKERFCHDPLLRPWLNRVAARYVAGHTVDSAVARVKSILVRGHGASAEYMGESCRDRSRADAETAVFLDLISALDVAELPCSISLDLSHIGSAIDPELGFINARRIAAAAAVAGREVMISMEGSDRADGIYATYARLHNEASLSNVGITIPAKLHRTAEDLPVLMAYPGRIRLVKGAFAEPAERALRRHDPELGLRYRHYARQIIASGRKCSVATHDVGIQRDVASFIRQTVGNCQHIEFESLIGLGTAQIDDLRERGFQTREYAVFGEEHYLYVLNRIAEEPMRLYQALIDLAAPVQSTSSPEARPVERLHTTSLRMP